MKIADINNKLMETWWALLSQLSAENRLELASRLINSLKVSEPEERKKSDEWKKLYGAWADDEQSAEELIELIRKNRIVNE